MGLKADILKPEGPAPSAERRGVAPSALKVVVDDAPGLTPGAVKCRRFAAGRMVQLNALEKLSVKAAPPDFSRWEKFL